MTIVYSPNIDIQHYNSTKNVILKINEITKRYIEIYKITCMYNNKSYIGQTVVHRLNHKKYRPYGTLGRFKSHLSEAGSNKYGQCAKLNEDIVKYGNDNFIYTIIHVCDEIESSNIELNYINTYNTVYPNGYNTFLRINKCLNPQSVEKYKNITEMKYPNEHYLVKGSIQGKHIGWRVRINKVETAFKSKYKTIEENKTIALDFIQKIRDYVEAKYLDAGTSLET
jgi:hypothetical protein